MKYTKEDLARYNLRLDTLAELKDLIMNNPVQMSDVCTKDALKFLESKFTEYSKYRAKCLLDMRRVVVTKDLKAKKRCPSCGKSFLYFNWYYSPTVEFVHEQSKKVSKVGNIQFSDVKVTKRCQIELDAIKGLSYPFKELEEIV